MTIKTAADLQNAIDAELQRDALGYIQKLLDYIKAKEALEAALDHTDDDSEEDSDDYVYDPESFEEAAV